MSKLTTLHIYQSSSFSGAEAYALEIAGHQSDTQDVTMLVKGASPLYERATAVAEATHLKVVTNISELELSRFDVVILHSTRELRKHWFRIARAKIKAELQNRQPPAIILYSHIWISHSKRDILHWFPYSVVDRVWCSSTKMREALIKNLPVAPERVKVVRYGRNVERFTKQLLPQTEARRKLGVPENALVVGTLARVDKGKGSLELFEAVTQIMPAQHDLHLLMIGPPTDGDPKASALDDEINAAIETLPDEVRARVHKLGRLEDGSRYLSIFDLFVLATYKETFALTLLEALCARVPCLATNSGGSPDLVKPDLTGWLFQPGSVDSLRETLETAILERNKWSEFGANGRSLVLGQHDFGHVMSEVEKRLATLVDGAVAKA